MYQKNFKSIVNVSKEIDFLSETQCSASCPFGGGRKADIIQMRKSFLWGFPMFETSVTPGWKCSDSVNGIGMGSVIVIV